jgi:arylsulfatase A-like enzyme
MAGRRGLTRRNVLKAGGAGALALGMGACASEDFERDNARAADAPNTLLLITDSTRLDYINAYNPDSRNETPNIDALAKESLRFDKAVPDCMPTGPARRTVLSGTKGFPNRDWVPTPGLPVNPGWSAVPADRPMFTELMGEAGISTAYCTDNPFLVGPRYADFRRTLDFARPDYSQAFYREFNKPWKRQATRSEVEQFLLPALNDTVEVPRLQSYVGYNNLYRNGERMYSAARVMRSGMRVLDEYARGDEPFFLGCDAFDPHEPFDPFKAYLVRFGDEPQGIERDGITPIAPFETPSNKVETIDMDEETLERVRELYAAEITFVDKWIGRVLNKLDDLGMADTTAVIYHSDHGLTLGEHGIIGKAASRAHWHIYKVPFMIRDPERRRAGQASEYFASTQDVARTLLSYMGVRPTGDMDGEDLSVMFEGKDPPAREFFTSMYEDYFIAGDGRFVLLSDSAGLERRLFDTDVDPGELKDIAADNPQMVDRLWTALETAGGGTLPQFGTNSVLGG